MHSVARRQGRASRKEARWLKVLSTLNEFQARLNEMQSGGMNPVVRVESFEHVLRLWRGRL